MLHLSLAWPILTDIQIVLIFSFFLLYFTFLYFTSSKPIVCVFENHAVFFISGI